MIDFVSAAPVPGTVDVAWNGDPLHIHRFDEHTIILRQSKSTSFEAPFIYLLFGNDRALLLDTGATADPGRFPLRATVDRLIEVWLAKHPRPAYELVVAHTHGHGDHVAADAQFADRPRTTVIARELEAVQSYFGVADEWPSRIARLDLGGRVLEVIPSPGHHPAAITFYDPWTGILLTGDTILPGRLYVVDVAAFRATLDRLVAFAGTRPVKHVLGCHIEMTTRPGRDYPIGATYQPRERSLALTAGHLTTIRDATAALAGRRGVFRFDDFILYQDPPKLAMIKLLARGLAYKLRTWRRRGTRTISDSPAS